MLIDQLQRTLVMNVLCIHVLKNYAAEYRHTAGAVHRFYAQFRSKWHET